MEAAAFLQELDAFKAERLAPIVGAGQTLLAGGDAETERVYCEYTQPDDLRHHKLGRQLLAAAAKMGTACLPGC
jgi:hypothetical protein